MIEEDKVGTLDSKAWCKQCRTTLETVETAGDVSTKARDYLEYVAARHERIHKSHEVTIMLYQMPKTR